MYTQKTVAVVITAYNEEEFVGEVIETLPAFVDRAYVIDDRSTDGTWTEIQQTAAAINGLRGDGDGAEDWIVPIRHDRNRGVGATIKTGYRHALEDEMDVTVVMNGDGQMDPGILHRFVDPVADGRADYAKGNRLLSREHVQNMSRWRRFGNGVLTLLTKFASGYWKTMDPQNGYTAISLEALDRLDLDALYDDYGFCNDILVKLNARRMRVADIEMEAVYGDEESTIEYTDFVPRVSMLLLRGFLWRLKTRYLVFDFHPLVVLYATAAFGIGGIVGRAGLTAVEGIGAPSPLLVLLVVLVCFFTLAVGMTFDVANNEHLEHTEISGESARYIDRAGESGRPVSYQTSPKAQTD